MSSVTAIVLAAGASERMGESKLLLPYRGSTVLNATIEAVAASAVDRVIVVTGANADEIEASLGARFSSSPSSPSPSSSSPSGGGADEGGGGGQGLRWEPPDPSRQHLAALPPSPEGREEEREFRNPTSPITVVRNPDYRRGNMSSLLTGVDADPDADAFVLVPGDLPTVRTAVIDAMVALWEDEAPWAAVTEYRDRIAHPFLVSGIAVEELRPVTGERVLGRALVEGRDDRVVHLIAAFDAPRDMNTPEDYDGLLGE